MANYYHEARAQVKNLKLAQEINKRKAERRAEVAETQAEHPLNLLVVDGRSCKLHRNPELYAATERQEGLIPWNGQQDNLIDRFDGRALLDIIVEYDSSKKPARAKSEAEQKLQKQLHFETCRDLVRLETMGLSESKGLAFAAAENISIRAAARTAAAAAYAESNGRPQMPSSSAAVAAGQGLYSAIGFSYGGSTHIPSHSDSDSDSDDDGDDDDDENDDDDDDDDDDNEDPQDAEDDQMDTVALDRFGLENFSYRLHKLMQQEGEQQAAMRRQRRRRSGRKKAMLRAKRLKGSQAAAPVDWRSAENATSAKLLGAHSQRGRSRSRSPSPGRRHEYFTESKDAKAEPRRAGVLLFAGRAQAPAIDRKAFEREDESILEALEADPAVAGPHCFPTHVAAIHGVKHIEIDRRSEREKERDRRERERDVDRDRDRDRGRFRSRSRSRERDGHRSHSSRDRGRDRERERGRGHWQRSRSRSRSPSWGQGRSRSADRGSRRYGRSRSRSADRGRGGGGASSKAASSQAVKAPAPAKAPSTSSASAPSAAPPAETPQERLKRIMQAQLNKQAQKDVVVTQNKRLQAEKERQARKTLDQVARRRSPSPARGRGRSRSRSRSPHGRRR